MVSGMLEQRQAETKDVGRAPIRQMPLLSSSKFSAEMAETAALQRILARVVEIEGRATDIRPRANLIDRDCVIALLQNQSDQGILQTGSGAGYPPIHRAP